MTNIMIKFTLLPVFIVLLLISACTHDDLPLLRVASNFWLGYESLYIAREQGFINEKKVRLLEMTSATEVMNAMRSGSIEAAALTLDEVLTLIAEGIDLKVILVMDISNGADTLIVRDDIRRLTDLKGKKIAYEQTAVGAIMMDGILKKAQLKPKDVIKTSSTLDEHFEAFKNHQVDAVITFEPVTSQLKILGGRVIFDSREIYGHIVDVLAVKSDIIDKNHQLLQHLVNGHFQAIQFIEQYPQPAFSIIQQRLKISPSEIKDALTTLELPDRDENYQLLHGSPAALQNNINMIKQVLIDSKLIQHTNSFKRIIDSRFFSQR